MDNLGYPHEAGHRGVSTSIEAVEAINPRLGNLQHRVLDDIRAAGLNGRTSRECAASTGLDYDSCQPRISELRRMGKVRDGGNRRLNGTGKRAICWIATGGGE